MNVNLSEREQSILRIVSEDGGSSVSKISEELNVSTVTIRSDLTRLADRGYIVRTRGGALPAFHPKIIESQKSHVAEKVRIAKAAAELIEDGDRVMISAGTTTALIPKYLIGKRDVHIVTNSTLVFPYARINPSLSITLIGGEFRPSMEAMVGPIALSDLERFHVYRAFIGSDGFSVEAGFTANLPELAEVVIKMIEQSDKSVVVADSSKYGKPGFARIGPLSTMEEIITDSTLDMEARKLLKDSGLAVLAV